MGIITGSCHKAESEEEIIVRILSNLTLAEIETNSAYSEFIRCINAKDKFLDYFLFQSFLAHILGNSRFKSSLHLFFDNLRRQDEKDQNLKLIGAVVIYLSKGTDEQKIKALVSHYSKFYKCFDEDNIQSFITDLIEINTENCLKSFGENLGKESIINLTEVWSKDRKKRLATTIFQNFASVMRKNHPKRRYLSQKTHNQVISNCAVRNQNSQSSKTVEQENTADVGADNSNLDKEEVKPFDLEDIIRLKKSLITRSKSKSLDNSAGFREFLAKSIGEAESKDQELMKMFLELSYNQLNGEYIRSWLYDDFLKDKSEETVSR